MYQTITYGENMEELRAITPRNGKRMPGLDDGVGVTSKRILGR